MEDRDMRLCIVMNKRSDNTFRPDKAFISKTLADKYIREQKAKDPEAMFDTEIVDFADIETMKVWLVTDHEGKCLEEYFPDMVFYNKQLAESAPKLMEYPEYTDVIEYTLKGPKFMDEYMEQRGITLYIHYQVRFTEDGEIDYDDPKSNTVEIMYSKDPTITTNEAIVDNDNPEAVHVSVYFTFKNIIPKDRLIAMARQAREDYLHEKFHLET